MDAGRELPLNTIFGAFYVKNVIKRDFLGIMFIKNLGKKVESPNLA